MSTGSVRRMRRLLLLVSVLVFVDTMLYAALTPLLPHFADALGLSKSRAGVLVGAYAAGALVGGLPGGFAAARLGARRSVLVGLTLMGVSSVGFAFAQGFWPLSVARFVQGCGSAFTWAGAFGWLLAVAPRDRRGALLGSALGAAVFGALFGPVVGAAAALVGREPVFAALGALSVVLGAWTTRIETAQGEEPSLAALVRAFHNTRFVAGLLLMALPALLFGVLSVLGPLYLSAAGWGAAAIGAVWLVSALVEAGLSPLVGWVTDRRGAMLPVRISLAAGMVCSLALAPASAAPVYALLVVVAGMAYGILFTPAFALLADGADQVGLAQGMGFGLMNAGWALGALIGPAAGGAIAAATGDTIPLLLSAALCAVALSATAARSRHHRAAVLVDGLPRDAASVGRE
jgi:MFS family permease